PLVNEPRSAAARLFDPLRADDFATVNILTIPPVRRDERLTRGDESQTRREEERDHHELLRTRELPRLCLGLDRFGRKRKVKRRSRAFLALHPDRSAVALDDLLGDVQAES